MNEHTQNPKIKACLFFQARSNTFSKADKFIDEHAAEKVERKKEDRIYSVR